MNDNNDFNILSFFLNQIDLVEWIEVLNIIDEHMTAVISQNEDLFLPDKPPASESSDPTGSQDAATAENIKRDLCVCLKFTIMLLDNAVNKEIYNSVEVCSIVCHG
jgi:hypothetical protein